MISDRLIRDSVSHDRMCGDKPKGNEWPVTYLTTNKVEKGRSSRWVETVTIDAECLARPHVDRGQPELAKGNGNAP